MVGEMENAAALPCSSASRANVRQWLISDTEGVDTGGGRNLWRRKGGNGRLKDQEGSDVCILLCTSVVGLCAY